MATVNIPDKYFSASCLKPVYTNLNLNQNQKCIVDEKKENISGKEKDHQIFQFSYDPLCNKHESPNFTSPWKKSTTISYDQNDQTTKVLKSTSDKSSSTLSLHIACYEDSISTSNHLSSQTLSNNQHQEKPVKSFGKKWKDVKKLFKSSSKHFDFFEIPRQNKDVPMEPEIMQFKASQKLLDPNQQSIYNSMTDEQKNLVDVFYQKAVDKEKEVDDVKLELMKQKQRFAELEKQKEVEEAKLENEINRLSKEFSLLQISTTTQIKELDGKISVLKDQSRYKYVLDFMIDGFDDDEMSEEEKGESESDEEYTLPPPPKRILLEDKYPLSTWEVIIAKLDKGWSIDTIKAQHKKVSDKKDIYRMKEYLKRNGSSNKKYHDIDTAVLREFLDMRNELEEIHDCDLIDAALNAAEEMGLASFKASEAWIRRFKQKYGIVSRKINAVVATSQVESLPELESVIRSHREKMKALIAVTPHDKVFNADQTGLKQEMVGGRTLAIKGERKVKAIVRRVNATTHSYTVQVLINAAGNLILPAMVVFCEQKRPNCFENQLRPFKNIKAYSHPSGLMTSELGKKWIKDIYKPAAGENSILMIDSWTGYKQSIDEEGENIQFHVLPPKTTSVAQPLDVYFNRPFKNFIRRLSHKIRRNHPAFDISNRQGMGTLLDIALGQFAAPVFNFLIKYSWYKAGYFDERQEGFETPVEYCFDSIKTDSACHCSKRAFIKCAHCDQFYCFTHFVKDLHRCYA